MRLRGEKLSLQEKSTTRSANSASAAGVHRLRHASLGVLALTVIEYGFGMYVNLYVTLPRADHGGSLGSVISNGPWTLTTHVLIGLLLGIAGIGVLVLSIRFRRPGVIILSAIGLLALASADATGNSFATGGKPVDSMGMSVLTGVALLCYAANLYLVRPGGQHE